jgi:hypothetical protein
MRLQYCRLKKRMLRLFRCCISISVVLSSLSGLRCIWTATCDAAFGAAQLARDARMNLVTLVIGVALERVFCAVSFGGFNYALLCHPAAARCQRLIILQMIPWIACAEWATEDDSKCVHQRQQDTVHHCTRYDEKRSNVQTSRPEIQGQIAEDGRVWLRKKEPRQTNR